MVVQILGCLIELDKFISLLVEKKKILKTTIFVDDELLQNAINAIYIKYNIC